jgi:hypothetical protein
MNARFDITSALSTARSHVHTHPLSSAFRVIRNPATGNEVYVVAYREGFDVLDEHAEPFLSRPVGLELAAALIESL